MNKENNRSAAGLRRSAIAERIRLREEWSELKGTPDLPLISNNRQHTRVGVNKPQTSRKNVNKGPNSILKRNAIAANVAKSVQMSSEVLVGVVALVEVGAEPRALALRAALSALGASVVPSWTPIVTHVVWTQGGCRATRAKARALASRLVSPLWVEACAASNKRLPEQAFPAAARASDLPSPRTLRQLLKKAEMENIPLIDLLSDDKDDNEPKGLRLRMSSETEHDTSADKTTDTSRDTSHDTSRDKTDIQSRVNTAPRRANPISISPAPPAKSRRKLFTQKEGEETRTRASDEESDRETSRASKRVGRVCVRERRLLERAERLARKLAHTPRHSPPARDSAPRIVLTGMGRSERQAVTAAIRSLKGRIQSQVNWKTSHVLLGSCKEDDNENFCSGVNASNKNALDISGVTSLVTQRAVHRSATHARTLTALVGAARGARVLHARWAHDCVAAGHWLHHHGYEVAHLKKISQKARIERTALCRMRSDYAYDVFNGMRVRILPGTTHEAAATALLSLCGGTPADSGEDLIVGDQDGQVNSKWVFDSVAAGRMRTTRRYINISINVTQVGR